MTLKISDKFSRIGLAVVLLVSAFAFAFSISIKNASAQAGQAQVRVAHMSPDAPAVDIYVDGNKALSNVAFKAVSNYLPLPAGEHRFEVRAAGAPATDKAVIDAKATVEAGKAYTVAATNELAKITPLVLVDDVAAPGAGKAKVRVVHASPDAPAVDVAVKGGPVLINNLAFGKASDTLTVDAKSYDLEVRPTGTTTVALPLNGVNLEAGKIYTVFAAGKVANLTAVPVAYTPAQGGGAAPAAPSTGFGGAEDNSFNYGLVAMAVLAVVALGSTVLLRSTRGAARK
jgi:hypothetical protein